MYAVLVVDYDLEERTGKFGEEVIVFLKPIYLDPITRPIVTQLVRSATSVGANYMEANQAESKKDFYHKVRISQKEASEAKHWFRVLNKAVPSKISECRRF